MEKGRARIGMHIRREGGGGGGGFFFFKQRTAYEVISRDWSSGVCSSDLGPYTQVDGKRMKIPPPPREHPFPLKSK